MCECKPETEPELTELIYMAASQIPPGMVSTYGDIAIALGDRAASRAVGEMLSRNPRPIAVPCHRVVYSTGETGWYGGRGKGAERKIEILEKEGVPVRQGKVQGFAGRRFRDFRIEPVLKRLRAEQEEVAGKIVLRDDEEDVQHTAGLDVSYSGDDAFAAISVMDRFTGDTVEERTARCRVRFPYIPTYLSYREIPALRALIEHRPGTIYLIDGQGMLHPRGAGIACHIGVELDIPTIGAAKSLLIGSVDDAAAERSPVRLDGEVKGCALRQGRKVTYVSPGHRVTLRRAADICSESLERGIPTPLRRAHELANEARREACA